MQRPNDLPPGPSAQCMCSCVTLPQNCQCFQPHMHGMAGWHGRAGKALPSKDLISERICSHHRCAGPLSLLYGQLQTLQTHAACILNSACLKSMHDTWVSVQTV